MEYKKQTGEYWNKSAKGYSKTIQSELDSREKEIWTKLILENAPGKECLKILDIGCGPGFMSIVMSKPGYNAKAADGNSPAAKDWRIYGYQGRRFIAVAWK